MKPSRQGQCDPSANSRPAAPSRPRLAWRFLEAPLAILLFVILLLPAIPVMAETLFTTQTPELTNVSDGVAYELGMKFQSAAAGKITAIRYWKAPSEAPGNHVGKIWDASGNQLATVTFTGETASGWQQQALATPLDIQADTTYVVSVNIFSHYVATTGGLATSVVNGNLSSVQASDPSGNGVFGDSGAFPTQSFRSTNYFVDVVFGIAGKCIVGEKYVSVNGPGGPFVRNSVTSPNPNSGAANPLIASVPGANNTPADAVNIPTALFGGTPVFYEFKITNCGTVTLYNVRVDDCADLRSVGDNGFLQGGANGNCVENPRLIPFSPQRIVASSLAPGQSVTVTSSFFTKDPISKIDMCEAFGRNRANGIIRNDSEVEANTVPNVIINSGETFVFFDDLNLVRCKEPGVKITKFTNGHDGDNANGVPSAGTGDFSIGTDTVAQVAPNGDIIWTYRVTNTGPEDLIDVVVTDSRNVAVSCPKTTLAVAEQMDCTATGIAQILTAGAPNVQGCGSGGTATRPTYENVGKVTAEGAGSRTPVEDSNPSHYCNPPQVACDLKLDKSCEIVQPPTLDWADCKGKLQQFSLIWPSNGGTINISGIANNAPGGVVNPGQRVTFTGPFSSNDLFLNISGAANGQSTFHVSCSDKDMDGLTATNLSQQQLPGKTQDCGKFEGDGKAKSGFINTWLLDGLTDADGKVLNCSPEPTSPTSSCAFQMQDPPSCGTGGSFKPSTLTFQYTGGGCASESNTQDAGKTSCSGQIDPALPVNVVFPGGTANNVPPGGTFTIPRSGANTVITLSNAGGTETDGIHTSCSQPLVVGDVYFSLTLVAEDDVGIGKNVKYSYQVTNTGTDPASNIAVVDDTLGTIGSIASLEPGATQTLTTTALIEQTTTNIATATAESCPGGVTATATVSVLPPPPCTVVQSLDRVEDDKYKLKLTNSGNKLATLNELVLSWPENATYGSIKEVKLDGSIYKADQSGLVVSSGVPIKPGDWTNADVSKRQLDPGETRTLEIVFKTKWPKANCPNGTCFSGTASFAQGCEVDLGQ